MLNLDDTGIAQIKQLLSQRDFAAADKLVHEILYEEPDCAEALCLLAITQTETGQHLFAIKTLQYFFSIGGSSAAAWEALGCARLRLKDFGQAEAAFLKALSLDKQMASVWRNLGVLFSLGGRHSKSFAALKKAASLDPNDILTLYALSSAYLQRNDEDAARVILKRLSEDGIPIDIRNYALRELTVLNLHPKKH